MSGHGKKHGIQGRNQGRSNYSGQPCKNGKGKKQPLSGCITLVQPNKHQIMKHLQNT